MHCLDRAVGVLGALRGEDVEQGVELCGYRFVIFGADPPDQLVVFLVTLGVGPSQGRFTNSSQSGEHL
jgi:hypothetical protein